MPYARRSSTRRVSRNIRRPVGRRRQLFRSTRPRLSVRGRPRYLARRR